VFGLLGKNRFQDRARFLLVCVGLIARRRVGPQRQRIENRRLAVVGIAGMEPLHRLFISKGAGAMVELVRIFVESLDGGNVVSLALGLGPHGAGLFDGGPTLFQILGSRGFPEFMVVRHRDSPVSHAAGGIFFGHCGKRLSSFVVPEGMEHGRGAIEWRLHRRVAGNRKIHLAKLLRFAGGVLVLGRCRQRQRQASKGDSDTGISRRVHLASCTDISSAHPKQRGQLRQDE
jgi:hypothetical protein